MKNKRGILFAIVIAAIIVLGAVEFLLFKKENIIVGKSSSVLDEQNGMNASNKPRRLIGDIDGDEDVDQVDLNQMTEYLSMVSMNPGSTISNLNIVDTNGDGEFNEADKTYLNNYINGMRIGDVNQDGVIDEEDITYFTNYINKSNGITTINRILADINGNGEIGHNDLNRLKEYVNGSYKIGDANRDGVIDDQDKVAIQKYLSGENRTIHRILADINGDNTIDTNDVTLLQKFLNKTFKIGDVNQDNEIDGSDITNMEEYLNNPAGKTINMLLADINGDGRFTEEDKNLLSDYFTYRIGDLNCDRYIDQNDLGILNTYLQGDLTSINRLLADINGDNEIDINDFYALQKYTYELGDVNTDSSIDVNDVNEIQGYISGISTTINRLLADINNDKKIDQTDIDKINQISGKEYGDVDCNGSITVDDASKIEQFIQSDDITINEILADVNGDKVIDANDASYIRGYLAYINDNPTANINIKEYIGLQEGQVKIIDVNIKSNNAFSNNKAKVGDTIIVTVKTIGDIYNAHMSDISIAGEYTSFDQYVDHSNDINTYVAELEITQQVKNSIQSNIDLGENNILDENGNIIVTISNYESISGNRGPIIYGTNDGSYVNLDTELPNIKNVNVTAKDGNGNEKEYEKLKKGDKIEFEVYTTEEIHNSSNMTLSINIGDNWVDNITGTPNAQHNMYKYTYTIGTDDTGIIAAYVLEGTLVDLVGNSKSINWSNGLDFEIDNDAPEFESINISFKKNNNGIEVDKLYNHKDNDEDNKTLVGKDFTAYIDVKFNEPLDGVTPKLVVYTDEQHKKELTNGEIRFGANNNTIRYTIEGNEFENGIFKIEKIDGSVSDLAGNSTENVISLEDTQMSITYKNTTYTQLNIDKKFPYLIPEGLAITSQDANTYYIPTCEFSFKDNSFSDTFTNVNDKYAWYTIYDLNDYILLEDDATPISTYNKVQLSTKTALQDGEYYVVTEDILGNKYGRVFIVDTTAPVVNVNYIQDPTDGHVQHVELNNIVETNLKSVKLYEVDNETLVKNSNNPLTFDYNYDHIIPQDTPKTYLVEVTDCANHTTEKYFKVDTNDTSVDFDTIEYGTPDNDNGVRTETVTIKANEFLQEVDGWTLSEDRKSLTKKYTENTTETVTIEDLCGNTVEKTIQVIDLDDLGLTFRNPDDELTYVKDGDEIVILVHSDKLMKIDEFKINGKEAERNNGFDYRNDFEVRTTVDSSMSEGRIVLAYTCTFQDPNEGTKRGSYIGEDDSEYDLYIIDRTAPEITKIEAKGYDSNGNEITDHPLRDGDTIRVNIYYSEVIDQPSQVRENNKIIKIGDEELAADRCNFYSNSNGHSRSEFIYTIGDDVSGRLTFNKIDRTISDLAGNETEINITNFSDTTKYITNGITIDNEKPVVEGIAITADGLYNNKYLGKVKDVTFTLTLSKNITAQTLPTLNIKIGSKNIALTNGSIDGNKIIYTYTTGTTDYGEVTVTSLVGGDITDTIGNPIEKDTNGNIQLPETISGDIFVDTFISDIKLNLVNGTTITLPSYSWGTIYINDFITSIECNDDSGISSRILSYGEQIVSGYNFNTRIAREGYWELELKDNVANEKTYSFIIDATAPVVKLNGEDTNDVESIENIRIEVTDDNIKSITLTKDGSVVQDFNYQTQDTIYEPGVYVLTATDEAGNVTTKTFSILRKAPIVSMFVVDTESEETAYTSGTWTNKSVKVKFTFEDENNTATVEYKVGENWQAATNNEITFDQSGQYTLVARAKYANNKYSGVTEEKVIKIDKTVPTIGNITVEPAEDVELVNEYYNGNVTITFPVGEDENSGVGENHYSINDEDNTYTSQATNTLNRSGNYVIEYYTVDNAGNKSETKTATIKIDKDAPVIKYVDESNESISGKLEEEYGYIDEDIVVSEFTYFNKYVKLVFTDKVNDTDVFEGSGIKEDTIKLYKYDEEVNRYTEFQDMPIMRDGIYIVTVQDNAGHRTTKGFVVDTTSPRIKINNRWPEVTTSEDDIKYNYYNTEVEIDALEDNAEIKAYIKGEDGKYTEEYRFLSQIHKITAEGTYKIEAKDGLGNTTIVYVVIGEEIPNPDPEVDTTAPEISSLTASTTEWTINDVTLTVVATDNAGQERLMYSWDNEQSWTTSNTYTVSENSSVNNPYKVIVKDIAGNKAERTIQVTNIDKIAPVVSNITNTLSSDATEVTLTVVARDNQGGSGIKEYSIDNGVNWQTANTFTVNDNGIYTVIVKDNVDNISTLTKANSIEVTNIINTHPEVAKFEITNYGKKTEANKTYVTGISAKTTVAAFKQYIVCENLTYTIYDRNGNVVEDTDLVATNMKIVVSNEDEYILVVRGDVNSDGKIDISDLSGVASYYVGKASLDRPYQLAADVVNNNVIDISDISAIARAVTQKIIL